MSENMKIWDQLARTDPAHTQKFKRAGGFSGTAIKPIWSFRRMTEMFGPCGQGWTVGEPTFQVVPGHNGEVLVYCTVPVWWREEGEAHKVNPIYGVGGDKVVTHIKANEQYNRPERWENDDEAFKKAFTDAVTNALKLLGVGADVHMGLFDDSKYVQSMKEEFADEPAVKSSAQLKREDVFPKVLSELANEMLDVQTFAQFEQVKEAYRKRARDERWNTAFLSQLAELFEGHAEELQKRIDAQNAAPADLSSNSYAKAFAGG